MSIGWPRAGYGAVAATATGDWEGPYGRDGAAGDATMANECGAEGIAPVVEIGDGVAVGAGTRGGKKGRMAEGVPE